MHELHRRRLAGLQPDDRAHPLLCGERGHCSRIVEVTAKRPLTVHGLARCKCGEHELSMMRNLHRDHDDVDVWLDHQLLVV